MQDKKILITGGAGYIGSHTVKTFLENGYKNLIILDNLELGHEDAVLGGRLIKADLRNRQEIEGIFANNEIDLVVHFAAYASVPDSVLNPAKYFENNVVGSINLLEVMRQHSVNKIVFSSSAAVYGESQANIIKEGHPKSPTNPYGYTKLIFEEILKSYNKAYGLSSISFRYFCAAGADPTGEIGERHSPETHLIPLTILALLGRGPDLKIFGADYSTPDGTGVRDYIHVNDLASGHILGTQELLKNEKVCKVYNMGRGYSVQEIIDEAEKTTGKKVPRAEAPRRPGDPPELVADSSLVKKELSWKPKFNLHDMIETAFNFYKNIYEL